MQLYIVFASVSQEGVFGGMVTLFQIGLKKTSKPSRQQTLASLSIRPNHQLPLPETCWEIWYLGPRAAILSPKAPSTIVSLWSRDLRMNNGNNCLVMVWGPMIVSLSFCVNLITVILPIFGSIFKTIEESEMQKMMLQKTFVKDPEKLKVTLCLG